MLKSRYCVKCEAVYQWQCKCPNHKKHRNIMNRFKEISMVAVNETSKYCGIEDKKDG